MFKDKLREYIHESSISLAELCRRVGISRPYLYSVLSGESKPPTPRLQLKIAQCLNLSGADRTTLFDLAAEERGEIPADVFFYYMDEDNLQVFRSDMNQKRGDQA